MDTIEIVGWSSGDSEVLASVSWDGSKVTIADGANPAILDWLSGGITSTDGNKYKPEDGEKFFNCIPINFDGSYIGTRTVRGK